LILLAVRYPSNLVGIFLLLVGLAELVEVSCLGAGAVGGAVATSGLALGAGAVAVVDELAVVVAVDLGAAVVAAVLGADGVATSLGADGVAAGLGADGVAGEDADTLSSETLLPCRHNTKCYIRKEGTC
jgi:hypothetical protein